MSTLTVTPLNPFGALSLPELPDALRAVMNDFGEPVYGQGDLREIFPRTARRSRPDPVALLPGDYLLDAESSTVPAAWMRVDEVAHAAAGSWVRLSAGLAVFVTAGRPVWVWRAADVLAWMVPGESAGAR